MKVTVRFAPSPTGYLHVGGQRTALYNYLFARKQGGRFILRIEDTDRGRYVEGAVEALVRSLSAMGIEYDAGPGKEDGHGPYFQSHRLDIYREHIDRLLGEGHAYRCFCTPERLEELREGQIAEGKAPGYDGHCRSLDPDESRKRAESESYVIRLRVPSEGSCEFDDIIRGHVTVGWPEVDDQVLLKSDGYPTYHFANVVDDHLMEITHVIRGEEWLPSLPKHILLYDLFGWDKPKFAHLPLLLNEDRSKLSKRQGDVAVEDYLAKGYLPQALNNFLALLGWNPGNDREFFTLDELVEEFDLSRVNRSGAVFDRTKLNWMNSKYIQNLDEETYFNHCRKFTTRQDIKEDQIRTAWLAVKSSLTTFQDLDPALDLFAREPGEITEEEALELLADERIPVLFRSYIKLLKEQKALTSETFRTCMKDLQKMHKAEGIKGKYLWMPIRLALTGQMHGPELPFIAEYFGLEENIMRVSDLLMKLENG